MTTETIHATEVGHTRSLEHLYKTAFPVVARFVASRRGSLEDARDIFHDALVIYYEKQDGIDFMVSETAYVLGIAKHLWIRKYRDDAKQVDFDSVERMIDIPDDYFRSFDENKLLDLLARSGQRCLELLKSFYYDKSPLARIAQRLGYTSIHSATVQKYKCIEKIREEVKQKALHYEDFLE